MHDKLDGFPGHRGELSPPQRVAYTTFLRGQNYRQEKGLVVTKAGVGGRGAGGWGERSGYKRTTQGIFVVMEMLCVLVSTPPVTLHYGPATHHPQAEEKRV